MIIGLVAAGLFPPSAFIFGIDMPDPVLWLAAIGLVALGGVGLELAVYRLPRLAQELAQRLRIARAADQDHGPYRERGHGFRHWIAQLSRARLGL